jgi:thiol:disulfide interchange protein DsbD
VLAALASLAWLAHPIAHAAELLDPQDAFKLSTALVDGGKTVEARFTSAPGYYLYRERFSFAASDGVKLGAPHFPPGEVKFDETFNRELVIYRGDALVKVPVQSANGAFAFTARLQGCADQGVCYPPEVRTVQLARDAVSSESTPSATSGSLTSAGSAGCARDRLRTGGQIPGHADPRSERH